jgi:predicted HTH domain antitoxin
MAIHIQLPADIEQELRRETPNLDENAREQFLICKYQEGKLSTADIAEILGFETRLEAQRWLAGRGVPLNYSLADLEQDRKNLQELFGRE